VGNKKKAQAETHKKELNPQLAVFASSEKDKILAKTIPREMMIQS